MRKDHSIIHVLGLACAFLIAIACATQSDAAPAGPPNSGHLLVYRRPDFGANLGLVVSIDGKVVGTFLRGHNYSGYLPAGQHLLSVRVNRPTSTTAETAFVVAPGQTYSFTANYSSGNMALTRNR